MIEGARSQIRDNPTTTARALLQAIEQEYIPDEVLEGAKAGKEDGFGQEPYLVLKHY